ncbi:AAA domain-containing protein [Candidatus Woesearchaeota archaeon]|nr:AAA domain-containing protein [Candidatus Woesearchaeota archaeon]
MTDEILTKLDKGVYQNSTILDVGGLPISVRELLLKAPLLAGLNVYLVGGTGEGKTQLAHDLASYFGDSYCYAAGRPDFEPGELLKHVRLDKLKDAKSDRDLVELTENVQKTLFYVDELNRCPPITQNYFFDFFDGKIVHAGRIIQLGKKGYSIGYATGNIGDGAYVGVSDSDRALKDRMHMIIKLDYPDFQTTESDDFSIFSAKKDPRASMPESKGDCLDEIVELHNRFKKREVPMILPLLGIYFTKGLDYLEDTSKHSKRALDEKWPNVEGIRQDSDESAILPLSKRAVFGAIALSQAIEMIAESKGHKIESSVPIFLDCLRFTVPYSGVLAPNFVHNDHDGDAYAAFDAFMKRNRDQINDKLPNIEMALALAEAGQKDTDMLDEIASENEGKWIPIKNAISAYADYRVGNQSEEGKKIKEMLEESAE